MRLVFIQLQETSSFEEKIKLLKLQRNLKR